MPWYDFYVGIGGRPVTAKIELKQVPYYGILGEIKKWFIIGTPKYHTAAQIIIRVPRCF
jgi:hypothetical protein